MGITIISKPNGGGSGSVNWGAIGGTLADQTDLNSALAAKAGLAANTYTGAQTITGGTVTASTPLINITQTWNNAAVRFRGEVRNFTGTSFPVYSTTWGNVSTVADWQLDGVTKFALIPRGSENCTMLRLGGTDGAHPLIKDNGAGGLIIRRSDDKDIVSMGFQGNGTWGITLCSGARIGFNRTATIMGGGNSAADTWFDSPTNNQIRINGSSATPTNVLLRGSDGLGTNISGGYLSIAAGIGTGNGNAGRLAFKSSAPGSSGSTAHTLADVFYIDRSTRIDFVDGVALGFGTSTGSKIGESTTEKIGFWGAAPVAQPSSSIVSGVASPGGGAAILDDTQFDGGSGSQAYTIGGIVAVLKAVGILG